MPVIAFMSGSSMNGPFFCERMLLVFPLHDELIGSFVVACLVAQRRHAPGRQRMVAFYTPLTAAMRVIDRIHHHAPHRPPDSHVPRAARLSDGDVFMVEVAHLADRGNALTFTNRTSPEGSLTCA